jgi:hypothetical protein
MRQSVLRHERNQRVIRVLDNGSPAELLYGPKSCRAVIEISRQDDANYSRSVGLRRRAEQRIDGRTKPVLFRTARGAHDARLDDQMMVRW